MLSALCAMTWLGDVLHLRYTHEIIKTNWTTTIIKPREEGSLGLPSEELLGI